jgi:hypothetical protein
LFFETLENEIETGYPQVIRKWLFVIAFYNLAKLLILLEPASGLEPLTY